MTFTSWKFWMVSCFTALAIPAWAQDSFETPLAITHVSATIQAGTTIDDATIIIDNGRIVSVAKDAAIPNDARVIDGSGLHAYPGFIDAATHLGIGDKRPTEEQLDRIGDDEYPADEGPRTHMQLANRLGVWPHIGVLDLYKHDADAMDAYRKQGFTTALVTPKPDIISGSGDVIQLSGKPLRSSTLAPRITQVLGFGDLTGTDYSRGRTYPASPMGAVALIRQTYMDADWYRKRHALYKQHPTKVERVEFDPALDAMGPLLDRKQTWIFAVDTPNEIHHAIDLSIEFNQRIAILGGKEAWKVADRLAALKIPVIVSLDFDEKPKLAPEKSKDKKEYTTVSWTPEFENDFFEPLVVRHDRVRVWEEKVNNLHALMNTGVQVAITTRDLKSVDKLSKNIEAALELELTPDELLTALSASPASILGLDKQLGTLESGKLANIVLLTEPLGTENSQISDVFVDGTRFTYTTEIKEPKTEPNEEAIEMARTEIKSRLATLEFIKDSVIKIDEKGGWVSGATITVQVESGAEDTHRPTLDQLTETLRGPGISKERVTLDVKTEALEHDDDDADPEDKHPWSAELAQDRKIDVQTNKNVFLRNATVLTVTNDILNNTDILVKNGKIREIGINISAPEGITTIDLTGYWVAPGFIDPHSHIAVTGINEWTESISSEVRQADVVDHTAQSIYAALGGGVTTIHTMHGSANSMGGQNAVLKLKYNTSPADMLVTSGPRIVKFALGENVTRSRPIPRFPNSRMGVESVFRHAFNAALEYDAEWTAYTAAASRGEIMDIPRRDLRLQAISDILAGRIWVHSHSYRGDEILRLLRVAEDYGFRIATMQHVLEGYRVAPEMYAHGVGGSTFADWWSYKKEAFDAIPYNAAMMMEQGVVTSLNSDSPDLIRHLNFEAGKTMRFGGLTAEQAMKLITINPAIQLGLDSRIGSIEVGKDGDFAVFTAHPLDTHSRNVLTLIEGEIFFQYPGLKLDGSTPGPGNTSVPNPAREPLPLPDTNTVYAIVGATIHPVSSAPIENGTLIINNGKIQDILPNDSRPVSATVVDATGLHVYPGLVNASTQMGLSEISGLSQTVDSSDLGTFQPELRALSAVNPHSEHIGVSLCEGITLSHAVPLGGIISGRGSIVQMAGWSLPEMLRSGETGLIIDLPVLPSKFAPGLDEKKYGERVEMHQKSIAKTEAYLREALHYANLVAAGKNPTTHIRYDAMIPYVTGQKSVFFRAQTYKEILQVLKFAEAFALKPVILGGGEAWKLADTLAEKNIPVVVDSVFDLPFSGYGGTDSYERFNAFYENPAKLEAAGVLFAIASTGTEFAKQLPVHAGFAEAHGLSHDAALKSITLNAAKILGIDNEVGSLESGKVADIIITTGDPTQTSTRTLAVFLNGKPVELDSLHERSYTKFSNRPDPDLKPTGTLRGPPPMRTR